LRDSAALNFAAGGVDDRENDGEVPGDGQVGAEDTCPLATLLALYVAMMLPKRGG
jgi:hypothetical protein